VTSSPFTDSPYRKEFSEQILKLSELGVLNDLKDKWWKMNSCNVDGKVYAPLGTNSMFVLQQLAREACHMTTSISRTLVVCSWSWLVDVSLRSSSQSLSLCSTSRRSPSKRRYCNRNHHRQQLSQIAFLIPDLAVGCIQIRVVVRLQRVDHHEAGAQQVE